MARPPPSCAPGSEPPEAPQTSPFDPARRYVCEALREVTPEMRAFHIARAISARRWDNCVSAWQLFFRGQRVSITAGGKRAIQYFALLVMAIEANHEACYYKNSEDISYIQRKRVEPLE